MKRIISILLITFLICTLIFSMSSCSNISKQDAIGVWKFVGEGNKWTELFTGDIYLYVYKDGTGDFYCKRLREEADHTNAFEWSIDGEYFNMDGTKFTIEGDSMYDKQGKLDYTKVSNNTSQDMDIA